MEFHLGVIIEQRSYSGDVLIYLFYSVILSSAIIP